jgi:myo-inositol-1(or 4)-monophosphatase
MSVLTPVEERLNVAKMLAYDAGKILLRHRGRLSGYEHKGKIDLVTAADRESEKFLVTRLQDRFPGDGILAEEGSEFASENGFGWIIDPLDGTTNFVHGHPMFAVAIAITKNGLIEAGVTYIPVTRELFFAGRGMGAFGPSGALHVSQAQRLEQALTSTGFPYNRRDLLDVLVTDVRRLVANSQGFRRMGSACIDLAYVAAGRYDAFVERNLKPWDTAAGAILVEEAGGRVSTFSGGPFDPFGPELAATNGLIHEELLNVLYGDRQ